jgi:ABC-2 type transport system ATP-binding protein
MSGVIEASGLGKEYGRKWALQDCTLWIPAGRVVGLVGPNGAGKTTLLHLAVGLLSPSAGSISVLGGKPGDGPDQLARSASSRRTRRPTPACRSRNICGWERT